MSSSNENATNKRNAASGIAALSICESLLVALNDLKILSAEEAGGVLKDAASAHHGAVAHGTDTETHAEVAAIIDRIIAGGNSIPRF